MADEAQPRIYPNPPPFWIAFTTANVEHIQRLRDEAGDSTDALAVPSDLEFLVPPPEPANGTFRHFGETRNVRCSTRPVAKNVYTYSISRNPRFPLRSTPRPASSTRKTPAQPTSRV